MLHWYTYETARSKARKAAGRIEPIRARWLELCWCWVGGLAAFGMIVLGLGALGEGEPAGLALVVCSPLAALVPVTVAIGLRRSARIERALDQLVQDAVRPADPPAEQA
ncbi:MAG: hypothetical protein Q8J89_00085 [Caulobacter sp.]|nr:hypothetical protein [Caulobacter sp.]